MLELKRDGHARVQTEIVEFIALPFSSSGLVISRSRVGNGKNVQKSVMHLLHFDAVVAVAVASFVRSLNIPEIACKWQNHSFTWIKYDSQKVYQTKLNFEKTVTLTGHLRSVSIFFKVVHPFLFCCYYLYFFSSFFSHFSGGSLCLSFDKFWDTVPPKGGGGLGERLFLEIRGGGVPPGSPSPYPISDPKIDILHTHFQTWPLKSIPFYQKLCHHNLD